MITKSVFRAKIANKTLTFRTQKEAAESFGVTPQYLHDILAGRREISDTVARKFGYRKDEVRYIKIGENS